MMKRTTPVIAIRSPCFDCFRPAAPGVQDDAVYDLLAPGELPFISVGIGDDAGRDHVWIVSAAV
jgi:hypothetical protein